MPDSQQEVQRGLAKRHNDEGGSKFKAGKFAEAAELYQRGVRILRKLGDGSDLASDLGRNMLSNLSAAFERSGEGTCDPS